MSRSHRVFEWFRQIGEEIQADWERLHQQAESDPQRAGHGGLLAHSHEWKGESPRDTMTGALRQRDRELAQHPRECLDFACVASLGAWVATASNMARSACVYR